MFLRITKWDKYPFILSGLLLPTFTIFVFFSGSTQNEITDHLALIVFLLALAGIGFTFWCKWKEEELDRKAERMEKKIGLLEQLPKQDEYKMAEEELEKIKEQIRAREKKIIDKIRQKLLEKRSKLSKDETEKYSKISKELLDLEKEFEEESALHSHQFLIFAALYATIGALAITQSVSVFSSDKNLDFVNVYTWDGFIALLSSNYAFVIASYFTVAVLFIHCGILFFSSEAAKLIGAGNKAGVFASSLLLFFEVIALFYAATTMNSILNFSFWIIVLMAIDIVWVFVNIAKKIDALFQWLHLDSIMLMFLLSILFIYGTVINSDNAIVKIPKEVYGFVLLIFLARTIADYKMGWKKVWGKFDISAERI